MRFLYIGSHDLLSRHELGFLASLSVLGSVNAIQLGGETEIKKLRVGSDNGVWTVPLYRIPCEGILHIHKCVNTIKRLVDPEEYGFIFVTPRMPTLTANLLLNKRRPIVLRLWSVRAAKVINNMLLGCYRDLLIFIPSVLANLSYISSSTFTMTLDNATYMSASKIYPVFANRIIKVYPPYGYVIKNSIATHESKILEIVDRGDYILGFTILSKKGVYFEVEAKPQAETLYLLAKKSDIDVILAGSTSEDWRREFPYIEPPRNLHISGRGFGDYLLERLYRNAKMVVVPITFLSISNRFLEALFYGKPVITTGYVKYLHPELIHGMHVYISDNIVEDALKLLKEEYMLKTLEQGAKEAYTKFFSTKHNAEAVKKLIFSALHAL